MNWTLSQYDGDFQAQRRWAQKAAPPSRFMSLNYEDISNTRESTWLPSVWSFLGVPPFHVNSSTLPRQKMPGKHMRLATPRKLADAQHREASIANWKDVESALQVVRVNAPRALPWTNDVHALVMSNKYERLVALIGSTQRSMSNHTAMHWFIVTTLEKGELERSLATLNAAGKTPPRLYVIMLHDAEEALLLQGITPVWLLPGFGNRTLWTRTPESLFESCWDDDPKHSHPLNLLRFYLPELPELRQLDRLLMLDDDVCVRSDLQPFFTPKGLRQPSPRSNWRPVLFAGCDMPCQFWPNGTMSPAWSHVPSGLEMHTKLRHATWRYADTPMHPSSFLACKQTPPQTGCVAPGSSACAPKEMAKSLFEAHSQISVSIGDAVQTVHDPAYDLAWNYGLVLLDLQEWRSARMTHRFELWINANQDRRWFAPWTLAFGLGLPYLAQAGRVSCLRADTAVDGLGFLKWSELRENDINETRMEQAAVFHWAVSTSGSEPAPLAAAWLTSAGSNLNSGREAIRHLVMCMRSALSKQLLRSCAVVVKRKMADELCAKHGATSTQILGLSNANGRDISVPHVINAQVRPTGDA